MSDEPTQNQLPVAIQAAPWRRRVEICAEIALVFIILALLVLTWLPSLIGAHPGSGITR